MLYNLNAHAGVIYINY